MAQKIFIVHGWTYGLSKWDTFLQELTKLGYDPVLLKVPGLSAPSEEVWDIEKYVAWLDRELKDQKDVIAIGHSNGGRILMAYDAAHTGRLQRLFLIASAGIHNDSRKRSVKRQVFSFLAKALKPIARGSARTAFYRAIGARDYGNAPPNMRRTMINVTEHDKTFDPATVSVPATLIWGRNDTSTPIYDADMLKIKLQNADALHVLENVGHSPHADAPGEVASIIDQTLKAH